VKALKQTKFAYQPLISILVPTYNVQPNYLNAAIQSVLAQVYLNWELLLVDDGSTNSATLDALAAIEALDERIFVRRLAKNGGISAATNTVLREARGEFVAMLDHDDELTVDALHEVVRALDADQTVDVVYTDQDYVSPDGAPVRQQLKPDWSPELFRGVMYVGHLLVVRRQLALEVGGFDSSFDFVQDFEFMLRLSEHTKKILHIPKILYHWRCLPTSVAGGGKAGEGIEQLQAKAVQAHLGRLQLGGLVKPSRHHAHRTIIEPDSSARETSIDLFVHCAAGASGNAATVDSCLVHSGWPIRHCSFPPGWDAGKVPNARSVAAPHSNGTAPKLSDVERLRQLLAESKAEVVLVMSADLVIKEPDWLNYLLLPTQERDVAAVCAALLLKDGVLEHAGAVIGADARIRSAMRGLPPESDGYAGSLSCAREISTCWADLVALRRSAIAPLLMSSPIYSTVDFTVADLALRATRSGFRIICNPRVKARLSGSRKANGIRDLDEAIFADVWSGETKVDPYYNSSFRNDRADYT
jgi:GT2 family glycosyltransferase